MFKLAFVYLLLIHILGDYYFQSEKLAEDKSTSIRRLLIHGLIYTSVSFVSILPIWNPPILIAIFSLSASHLLIDIIKYLLIRTRRSGEFSLENQRAIYLADQAMHITCILAVSYILTVNNVSISLHASFLSVFNIVEISPYVLLPWITIFLLIWKPANISIKQLLCLYKPADAESSILPEIKEVEESSKKTGGFIGFLERLIILIFLSINQYSAIGLVLTAKSIARYNKITENKEFAEYYLLGTLLSTVIVIGAYLLLI